jgi:hypothetical protein
MQAIRQELNLLREHVNKGVSKEMESISLKVADQIFLITSRLVTSILLGVDFCKENEIILNSPERKLLINSGNEDEYNEVQFTCDKLSEGDCGTNDVSKVSYVGQAPKQIQTQQKHSL